MQESKQEKNQAPTSQEIEERQSDATSKETLEDLKQSEKISDSKAERAPEDSRIPSPDGTTDKSRNQRDDAGPM